MNWWSNSNKETSSLTIESVEKAIEYLKSPEYQKKENERFERRIKAEILVNKAYDLDRITFAEWQMCRLSIEINGMLIIPPSMAHKFEGIES